MLKRPVFILCFLIISFLFLRFYHLEASLNFGSDQGLTLLETYNIYKSHRITLISQSGASWTTGGRYLFFSSLPYYIYMPVLILFNWNPLSVSYLFIILQFIVWLILYKILTDRYGKTLAVIFSILWLFNPILIEYSRFVWASNLHIPLSALIIAFILILQKSQKNNLFFFFIGILFGVGFSVHFAYLLAIIISFIWLFYKKVLNRQNLLLIGSGFTLAISPLILFELRHNFYNLQTLIFIFTEKKKMESASFFAFNPHYVYSLIPFLLYFLAILLEKLKKKFNLTISLLLTIYVVYSAFNIMRIPKQGFTMTSGWNYKGIQKIEAIIISQNTKPYNIVDILTGDTRAYALRYLLTIENHPPLGVTDYPNSKYLYVYSKVSIDQILKGSLWELDTVKPVRVLRSWPIQNGVYLYLLEKA